MLLNQIPCANEGTHCAKGPLACLDIAINFHLRPSEAEARPDGSLNDFFNVFPCLQIIFNIKPLFHPGSRPSLPECWHWVSCIGASNKAITTEVVVILFFASGLRLI
jgi:hypothetical protein